MNKYPDQIDGLHRYAEVYEAMGEEQKAAKYWQLTLRNRVADLDRRLLIYS